MPIITKPCAGSLSEETIELLRRNSNREQWASHTCETCGQFVGVEMAKGGNWVPERHWPTAKYPLRKETTDGRQPPTSASPGQTGRAQTGRG